MADVDAALPVLDRASAALTGFRRPGVELAAEPSLAIGKVQLQRADADRLFEQLFGRAPPAIGRCETYHAVELSWLAPGEWLVTGPDGDVAATLARTTAAAGGLSLATDLGHGRAAFLLWGRDARDTLAALTSLDLSTRTLSAGGVARAPLGQTSMFLARRGDRDGQPCFRIIVDQTMAAYAERMLLASAPIGAAE